MVDTDEIEKVIETLKKETTVIESFNDDDVVKNITTDERMNYIFVKPDDIKNKVYAPIQYTTVDSFDYGVVINKKEDNDNHTVGLGELDETRPASFFRVKTVEEGIDYYLTKNPELPEGVAELMARYTFGKETEVIKTEPVKRNKKKKTDKLEVKHGKFVVDFS